VTTQDGSRRGGWTRLGRALGFVALVWGVALSFVGFDLLFLRATGALLGNPGLAPDLTLSGATRGSKTCIVEPGPESQSPPPEALVGAWILGLTAGRDALARQHDSVDREVLARALAEVAPIAERLGVPPTAIFVPQHAANANVEFVPFVEADASGTGRRLALRHGTQSCHLYKLGAFWGYASLVRPSLPGERAVFAPEIRYHAERASLSPELWRPLVEATPSGASFQEIAADSIALTQRVTGRLQRAR
jgi:hypothetical protein